MGACPSGVARRYVLRPFQGRLEFGYFREVAWHVILSEAKNVALSALVFGPPAVVSVKAGLFCQTGREKEWVFL